MKTVFFVISAIVVALLSVGVSWYFFVYEPPEKIIYFFYAQNTDSSMEAEKFLDDIDAQDPEVAVYKYETWYGSDSNRRLKGFSKEWQIENPGLPFIVIGNQGIVGFESKQTTGNLIMGLLHSCQPNCDESINLLEKVDVVYETNSCPVDKEESLDC